VRYFFVAILVVSLLGCVPYSDNPLTNPSEQSIDSSILGTWFWKDGAETGYLHIGIIDEESLSEASEFSGHTSSLEGNKYLNLSPANEPPGYIFVKYNVNQELLGISMIITDAVEKGIDNGSLNGEVTKSKWSSSIHITEGQKNGLRRFI